MHLKQEYRYEQIIKKSQFIACLKPIHSEDEARNYIEEIRKEFTSAYERLYSFSSDDAVQIVNFGLSAIGDIIYPVIHEEAYDGEDSRKAKTGSRKVYEGNGAYSDYDLYDREKLRNGNVVYGPAIVEQMDSTTIILKGQKATVDQYLNMMIERV